MPNEIEKLIQARTQLVLRQPFFGAMALRLTLVAVPGCGTAFTNGEWLGFEPSYVSQLPLNDLMALFAEEVLHNLLGHPWRTLGREHLRWNLACDKAIFGILEDAHFSMGQWLKDNSNARPTPQERGKSAEWIYDHLPLSSSSNNREGGPGKVRPTPPGNQGEEEWKAIGQQAANAAKAISQQGSIPAGLSNLLTEAAQSRVHWRSLLRRFIQTSARADYTWSRPNTRYLHSGLLMPSLRSPALGTLAIAVDTSGSIDGTALGHAKAEFEAIVAECRPQRTLVLYADVAVARMDIFEGGELPVWRPEGGGGTDFRSVFITIAQQGETPSCLIYITDLVGTFPSAPPAYPVLWAAMGTYLTPPWGEIVRIQA